MNKKEKHKGQEKQGFGNRGFGETKGAKPLKLQGKCCFGIS